MNRKRRHQILMLGKTQSQLQKRGAAKILRQAQKWLIEWKSLSALIQVVENRTLHPSLHIITN